MDREELIREYAPNFYTAATDDAAHEDDDLVSALLRDFADELEKDQTTTCPACLGEGDTKDTHDRSVRNDCPTCHGSGRIPLEAALLLARAKGIAEVKPQSGLWGQRILELRAQAAALIEGRK